jgi:hypothetical protein
MIGLGQTQTIKTISLQTELPSSVDGIVEKVREILSRGSVQEIIIRDGEPITYQKVVTPGEEITPLEELTTGVSLNDMARNIDMEEFNLIEQGLDKATPQTILFWMYFFLEYEGWVPTHLLVSKDSQFWPWAGLPRRYSRKCDVFLNLEVHRDEVVPSNVAILFGSTHKHASVGEVKYALKVTTEALINARTHKEVTGSGGNPSPVDSPSQEVAGPTR